MQEMRFQGLHADFKYFPLDVPRCFSYTRNCPKLLFVAKSLAQSFYLYPATAKFLFVANFLFVAMYSKKLG